MSSEQLELFISLYIFQLPDRRILEWRLPIVPGPWLKIRLGYLDLLIIVFNFYGEEPFCIGTQYYDIIICEMQKTVSMYSETVLRKVLSGLAQEMDK